MRARVESKKLDGVLTRNAPSERSQDVQVELLVRNQPAWLAKLQPALDRAKSLRAIQHANLRPELLEQMVTP